MQRPVSMVSVVSVSENSVVANPADSCCRNGMGSRATTVIYLTDSISRAGGGLFGALRNLAQAIEDQQRYSPMVFGLYGPQFECDRALWGRLRAEAFHVRGPRAFGYAPHLYRSIQSSDPKLVHVHGLWMYPSVAAIRWSRGCKPYVVSPHGMLEPWALNNSRLKKRISATLYENRHLRSAACLHALNDAEARAIRAYGLKNPICVIPNGVALPDERKIATTPGSRRTLLFLGRLHPKKGLSALIEAWSRVQSIAEKAVWQLIIAGWDQDGHRSHLEALATKLRANSSIHFVGPRFGKDKEDCFRTASAFILPSLSEGLPMSVLEAWAWRLPVLMTPQCNIPEASEAGAAMMVEHNAESIAAGLHRLFAMNDSERERIGLNGRRLAESKFQWSSIAQQMAAVYDWLLGLGPRPSCIVT